ncbi:MAG: translation initiation factor IF-1 [Christensenellaceae bacterium]|jgi:translation initiation factor IF-1|nr:translation initiation factor IF-1 [Christensenellaceae bacterium]
MSKDDIIETEGVIIEVLPATKFKVKLVNGHIITAYLSGKMRVHYIKVCEGDNVKVEMSPYDLNKGRIIHRNKA